MENKDMNKKIIESLNWRYATKTFDSNKKITDEDINTILESARLSPSSYGTEMWKFLVIDNKEIREKLKEASYGQPQITDASHLIVITYRTDAVLNMTKEKIERTAKIQKVDENSLVTLKGMIDGSIAQKTQDGSLESWIRAQTYIPLGIMVETSALLQIDTCPMEGFISEKVDEILNLKDKNLKSITMLPLGYRVSDSENSREKVRRDFNDVVEFI